MRQTSAASYFGHVDVCFQSHIEGWASKLHGPGIPVRISVNDGPSVEVLPTILRTDVEAAGYGILSGFSYCFPEPLTPDDVVTVCFPDGSPPVGSPSTAHRTRLLELLDGIDLSAAGIELGPLNHPILSKNRSGVLFVDHAPRAELIEKYAHTIDAGALDPETICEIDIVWGGGRLKSLVPAGVQLRWCLASHVIEHTPDMIGWLQAIAEALPIGGLTNLAIPDRSRTFDWRREPTGLAGLIGAYIEKRQRPTAAQIFDHRAFSAQIGTDPPPDLPAAFDLAKHIEETNEYCDVHCHVFSPESFLTVMSQIARLDLTDFALRRFYPTRDGTNEFIVSLIKSDAGPEERGASYRAPLQQKG